MLDKIKTFNLYKNNYSSEEYLNNGGFDGPPIFMLGFSIGIIDDYSTSPICRKGCIARFKLEDIRNKSNFILDIQNFPGN